MKIFFIGQKGIPSRSGGVEKHVEDLSAKLAEQNHEVFVYTRFNYSSRKLKEYKKVKLISLPSLPTKHLDAISHTFLACFHVAFQRKVDVIHFHSIGPSFLVWLAKMLNPKTLIVATFHSQCYNHQKWNKLAQAALRLGEKMCVNHSDKIIVISRVLKNYVQEEYNKKAYYIPNGVMPTSLLPADKIIENWGLKGDDYLLNVSRLVRHKGIHHLIKAFKKINTNKKLLIVGDGFHTDDYVKELKRMAQGDPRIIFTGTQYNSTLKELFSNASIFIQPSESEGLSIALLEAMSYGLPVIASDIKENQEALGEGGVFFKDKEVDSLVDKLNYLLSHPEEAREKGKLNQVRTLKEYDWGNIAEQVQEVYKS